MYEYIKGTLIRKMPNSAVIDVQGVGYLLEISINTFEALPRVNESCQLLTYLYVREDAQRLYGFGTGEERNLFLELTSVSGIGPKVALGILSGGTVEEVRQRILDEDVSALKRFPGIGPKTAKRIILELRETLTPSDEIGVSGDGAGTSINQEAVLALESLGYSRTQAEKSVKTTLKQDEGIDNSEKLIKRALKTL
ncbi:MAG TPA: Holliday junction branch migration protein RuvA [bacterium]|nr:Holliday junction branch migration protein RuvA [bacterium]